MKLFVVGSSSPDPGKWSKWDEVAIVIAADEADAVRVSGRPYGPACEIPMTSPLLLMSAPEPSGGADI